MAILHSLGETRNRLLKRIAPADLAAKQLHPANLRIGMDLRDTGQLVRLATSPAKSGCGAYRLNLLKGPQ